MKTRKIYITSTKERKEIIERLKKAVSATTDVELGKKLDPLLTDEQAKQVINNYKRRDSIAFQGVISDFTERNNISLDLIFREKLPVEPEQENASLAAPAKYELPDEEKYINMLTALLRAEDVKIRSFIRRDIEIFYERLKIDPTLPIKPVARPLPKKSALTEEEAEYIQQLVDILRSDFKETCEAIKLNIKAFHHSVYKEATGKQ